MKKLITTLLIALFLMSNTKAQIVEDFNFLGGAGNWIGNNGAGIQNYGGTENYATFNVGNNPYPNGTNIIIRSPEVNYTYCDDIYISFPLQGVIEDGYDIMYFQYKNNGSWITDAGFTGSLNGIYTSGSLPNTLTKFRFKLVADASVNTYGYWWNPYVYYYNIASFSVFCASTLPVELISFEGHEYRGNAIVEWVTATEINNDKFELYHSTDAIYWNLVSTQLGNGNSNQINEYSAVHKLNHLNNYYQLKQIDFNGDYEYSEIIFIKADNPEKYKYKYFNLLGQPVPLDYKGFKIKKLQK